MIIPCDCEVCRDARLQRRWLTSPLPWWRCRNLLFWLIWAGCLVSAAVCGLLVVTR